MNKTKIEWADSTWNPVTGCLHKCEYCYARKIATRFGTIDKVIESDSEEGIYTTPSDFENPNFFFELKDPIRDENGKIEPYPINFYPTFHQYRLDEPLRKTKPQSIFVCSMADLFGEWVPYDWISRVFAACERAPQHTYLFLTKNPQRYTDLDLAGKLPKRENMWYGVSVWDRFSLGWAYRRFEEIKNHNTFFSVEPIYENLVIRENHRLFNADWIIVGAETGNRKGKIIPEKEWIQNLCEISDNLNVPIFMKDSLIPIVGKENMRREIPKGIETLIVPEYWEEMRKWTE